ncbi:Methylosome subunit pICln, related [Neospora caninum Liverpool]|uniref:Methylosome subunit pICln, related n=1 Tax=Neospora caninum (strain Liverpool) TaxID=572307 RepID=F0VCS5_NEOCL|nr:Methylosome subunit pICln, related [Neospora caninum Liverpool]CBZ51440.1 Methylosome subunit pICln, related [Neospora caninum Liverpool]CEL65388.1 TPA: Methylosome subunit pICln, related [Neospora caninum Liverpool]|eukprot:XP_003881473.1 Methylosome subunit pICln, related [Neospora caninum Liverpool]
MPVQWSPARNADGSLQILQGPHGDEEVIACRENDAALILQGENHGIGTFYVTSRRVAWLTKPDAASAGDEQRKDIAVDYPSIVLHALSRDPNSGHEPCIYCQLKSDAAAEEDEDYVIPEMRIVPSSPEKLDTLFKVMSEMAALNPDPDADDGDDDEDDFIIEADGLREGGSLPGGWEIVEGGEDGNGAGGEDRDAGEREDVDMLPNGH